jgi:hypothetical protein
LLLKVVTQSTLVNENDEQSEQSFALIQRSSQALVPGATHISSFTTKMLALAKVSREKRMLPVL